MRSSRELAADTGVADADALADALIVLYKLATANTAEPARTAGITAKRIARLTLAAATASSSDEFFRARRQT